MAERHKSPLLGWHPPAELAEWVRGEAQRRGVTISSVLNELVQAGMEGRIKYAQPEKPVRVRGYSGYRLPPGRRGSTT